MNSNSTALLGAVAWTLVACAGDLDDPSAFAETMPIRAIRPANVYPLAVPSDAPTGSGGGPQNPPPQNPPPAGTGGAPAAGAGCARALEIFASPTRAGGSCHGAAGSTAEHGLIWVDLNFDQANLGSRLSTKMGTGACAELLVLDAANPLQSLLITKLTEPVSCGALMPFLGEMLSAEDKQCITDWVTAEAQALSQ
jgi:hypothetical protein